jgi:two-component system aerobic respiration control sensor histidine kinase ArcB
VSDREKKLGIELADIRQYVDELYRTTTGQNKKLTIKEYISEIYEYLQSIIANMPNNVYWLDKQCTLLGGNNALAKMFGLKSRKDLAGLNYDQMSQLANWTEKQGDSFQHAEIEVMTTGQPRYNVEEPAVVIEGKRKYYISSKVPLRNKQGDIIGLVGISTDITELKVAKEKAEEFNVLKQQFIQNMEHDIRTPMSGLQQILHYLSVRETEPNLKEASEMGLGAAEELSQLLDDIVNFDRIHYHHAVVEKPFKLRSVFESVYRINQPVAVHKKLTFRYVIDPDLPAVVLSDEYRIKHILLNLVGNALKFTQTGEVSFSAKRVRQSGRDCLVELTVRDTGMGIPADKLDVIFEKFVRLEPSNKGIYKGTGLGLASVKEYVQALDAEIKPIKSVLGKGTSVSVLIPMKASLDQRTSEDSLAHPAECAVETAAPAQEADTSSFVPSAPVKADSSARGNALYGLRVLLVEDSLLAQRMTASLFARLGCRYQIAESAEAALTLMEQHTYDVIFTDLGLPKMSGMTMTEKIRQGEAAAGNDAVIIIGQTAQADEANKKACKAAGMQGLLSKPLSESSIIDSVIDYFPGYQEPPVIDFERFKQLLPKAADRQSTLQSVLTYWDEMISELNDAYLAKDWKKLSFAVFKHKGGLSYLADTRLDKAMGNLYHYLGQDIRLDKKKINQLYRLMMQELTALKQAVQQYTQLSNPQHS